MTIVVCCFNESRAISRVANNRVVVIVDKIIVRKTVINSCPLLLAVRSLSPFDS